MRTRWAGVRAFWSGLSRSSRWTAASIVLLLGFALWLRVELGGRINPYCHHPDEHHWTRRAIHILQTGDPHPHRFTKPSVMIYLNAVGLSLGLARAKLQGEDITHPKQLGTSGAYPYYASSTVVGTLRIVYAIVAVLAMLLAILLVRALSKSNAVALLTALLLLASPRLLEYSWRYLNVDILGCAAALITITYLLSHATSAAPLKVAIVSGVLAGLTAGTKYNLFVIAAPAFVFIFGYHRGRWLALLPAFAGAAIVGFLLSTPYALLDTKAFIDQVTGEVRHYTYGHQREPLPRGLPMFWRYASDAIQNFSVLVAPFALWGAVRLLRVDYKRALIVFSYPFALLAFMSVQAAFFGRNLLILQLILPMLAAVGIERAWCTMRDRLGRLAPRLGRLVGPLAAVLVGLPLLLTTPWRSLARAHAFDVESRNLAVSWIEEHVPPDSTLLVAKELNMDARPLEARYRIKKYTAAGAKLSALRRRHPHALALIPEFRKADRKQVLQVGSLVVLQRFGKKYVTLQRFSAHEKRQLFTTTGNPRFSIVRL